MQACTRVYGVRIYVRRAQQPPGRIVPRRMGATSWEKVVRICILAVFWLSSSNDSLEDVAEAIQQVSGQLEKRKAKKKEEESQVGAERRLALAVPLPWFVSAQTSRFVACT